MSNHLLILLGFPCMSCFSLAAFKIFFVFVFHHFYYGVSVYGFFLYLSHVEFVELPALQTRVFHECVKVLIILFLNIIFFPFSFFFPTSHPIIHVLVLPETPHFFEALLIILYIFYLFFALRNFYC